MPIGTVTDTARGLLNKDVEAHRGRYYGRYAGFVRDRADPTKTGRCKVHVPGLLGPDSRPSNWLDWCLPVGVGLAVPPLNAPVWVTFENGQITHGVYEWGWLRGEDEASSEATLAGKGLSDPNWHQEQATETKGFGGPVSATTTADPARTKPPVYPYNKTFQTEGGHTFELDDSPAETIGQVSTGLRLRYRHPSGTTILVDGDGTVHIISAGAQYHRSAGDIVYQLGAGASFKVIYPNGSGLVVGPSGVHIVGDAATILGRFATPMHNPPV
jgi:hypothetical protein